MSKNKIIIMNLDFDEQLEKLFLQTDEENKPEIPLKKYRKIKKLEIEEKSEETEELDYEKEFEIFLLEGSFDKYMPNTSQSVGLTSSFLCQSVIERFLDNTPEKYSKDVEKLLNVHLEFPSRDELISCKHLAWTNLKILLKTLERHKGSRKLYNGMLFYRLCIIAKNGLKTYVQKLPSIYKRLKKIISLKTREEVEQIIILDEILTTFEKRILLVGDYMTCQYRDFEKSHLTLALNVYNDRETPFCHETFSEDISEYEFLFSPLKEIIGRRLGGKDYKKYIHLDNDENWSWYYLKNVDEKGNKYWKMDVFLDNLVVSLDIVYSNCIKLYENLYNLRYQDREYRKIENPRGVEEDLQILLRNMEILSNRKRCSDYIIKQFSSKHSYTPTENDIFDRRSSDPYIFALYKEITDEDIKKDWNNICNKIYFNYAQAQNL